ENPLAAPIYMVKLNTDNAVLADQEDITITLDEVPGFKLEVKEGSISVTTVNASKMPMAPPNGIQPQFVVTIQPTGTKFDPPAPLTLPNTDGHPIGAQIEMFSYDHDLEEFVAIGLGTVNGDGTLIESNPGVGVIKAGWHGGSPPGGDGCAAGPASCGNYCEDPRGGCEAECVVVADRVLEVQVEGDCKDLTCGGGKANLSDRPEDIDPFDCKTPSCVDPSGFEAAPSEVLAASEQIPNDCQVKTCDPNLPVRFDLGDKKDDPTPNDCMVPTCVGPDQHDYVFGDDPEVDNTGPEDCRVTACIEGHGKGYAFVRDQKPEDDKSKACETTQYECKNPPGDPAGFGIYRIDTVVKLDGVSPQSGPNKDSVCYQCKAGVEEPTELKSILEPDGFKASFPTEIVNTVSGYINKIPGLPTVKIKSLSASGNAQDCCSAGKNNIFEASLTPGTGKGAISINASIGMSDACWRLWPLPGKCDSDQRPYKFIEVIDPFSFKMHTVEAIIEGGLKFEVPVEFKGSIGGGWNECGDVNYCAKGSVNVEASPSLSVGAQVIGCYSVRDTAGNLVSDTCAGGGLSGSGTLDIAGGVSYDGCAPDPLSGSGFSVSAVLEIEGFITLDGDAWKFSVPYKL
ncbi:MAG: hypothetical protein GY820_40835, partial [Gammaproteobacteria bacterium]|nr:hypothetical protein [Gammaproteobacteria bacterium]